MAEKRGFVYLPFITLIFLGSLLLGALAAGAASTLENAIFLPLLRRDPPVEFRGLWVTRFDWAIGHSPTPAGVEQIAADAAGAGFNALLFQVRGTADAYYDSDVEPWAATLEGTLGADPGWDPLAHLITAAHAHDLQVHAYVNVYPVWTAGSTPPVTEPLHLYHKLEAEYGTDGTEEAQLRALQWNRAYEIPDEYYLRATPAAGLADDQLVAVVEDLVRRYEIDGIHLDNIRYGGPDASCDPVTETRIGGPCFETVPEGYASFEDWQRAQVNGTVRTVYHALSAPADGVQLSAAIWPLYESGYHNYYQDPKAWLAGGYIDTIMPMLYGSFDTDVATWQALAAGFQADSAGRQVVPGLGGDFDDFAQIAGRIEAARALGTAGHAIFSYSALKTKGYFDDLAQGPYAVPATPPPAPRHR